MKLPFKYIAVLVAVSLVTIFSYQVYWLVKMYNAEKEQTHTLIMNAIRNADHIEIFARVDRVSKKQNEIRHVTSKTGISDSGGTNISYGISFEKDETPDSISFYQEQEIVSDTAKIKRKERLQKKMDEKAVKVGEGYKSLEMMALQAQQGLHSAVDDYIGGVNLVVFDSILSNDLHKVNLEIQHYSRIIYLPADSIVSSAIPVGINLNGMDLYEYIYDMHEEYSYQIYTTPIKSVVLKQMTGILTSSFLLLLLLGFSFGYLIRTLMKQKTLEEMKTEFTNNITHELKTPIAVAYAATDALLNFNQADEKAKREKYLNITKDQLESLGGLVEQILSISMERRKTLRLKEEHILIKHLVDSLVESHTLKADKQARFFVDIKPDDLRVVADRIHFSNIISNLIDNALKYSPQDIEISICARQNDDNQLELSVADKGMGIPDDKQKYIFDKFYRVPSGNQHNVKGYGLGLFYVKTMIEKMGGTISVISEPGKGSKFTIRMNTD